MTKNEWMKHSYYERKQQLIVLLGGKCKECSSIIDLEFDHIDPKTKKAAITQLLTYKLETVYEEIEKCQLLCRVCHKLKNKIDNGEAKHGTLSMYRYHRCRCENCRIVWNLATKRWKLKRKKILRSGVMGSTQLSES